MIDFGVEGELRTGRKEQETEARTLYLHPDSDPNSKGKLIGLITRPDIAEEITKRWNERTDRG